jgi:hypothetical protein
LTDYDFTCTVAECDNLEEDSRGLCNAHIKRFVQGLVYENESGVLCDHCLKDHELTGDNVRWESSGKKGKKRRRCRECLREKARRQAANALPTVDVPKPYRPNDIGLTQAIRDFEEAQKHVVANCKDKPQEWMDWEDDAPPSAERARELCSGCPLLQSCANYALASQQTHGVWGGERIILGVWQPR